MRVHELAKKIGISSKELVEHLSAVGIKEKSHVSGLDSEQIALVEKRIQ